MNKQEFITKLTLALCELPQEKHEIEERVAFYVEMIEDRTDAGLSEEEAVAEIGSIEDIVAQTLTEIPLGKLVKEKIKPRHRFSWWEIVLIALGSPIWISVLASLFAVALSVYALIWSLVATLWASFVAVSVCVPASIALTILYLSEGLTAFGVAFIGIGLFLVGAAILLFFACRSATRGSVILTKKIALWIKRLFVKKGAKK